MPTPHFLGKVETLITFGVKLRYNLTMVDNKQ